MEHAAQVGNHTIYVRIMQYYVGEHGRTLHVIYSIDRALKRLSASWAFPW